MKIIGSEEHIILASVRDAWQASGTATVSG
jgi:hypothetical protein